MFAGAPERSLSTMTKAAETLLREALKLEVAERADLAAELLASLEGEPDDAVQAAWAAEIERRIEQIDAGTEKLFPWEEVERELDDEFRGR